MGIQHKQRIEGEFILREIYWLKKAHIEDQIHMLEKVRSDSNAKQVDKEIEFQLWRINLLDKYNKMSDEELRSVQEVFKEKIPESLWEIRKSPPLNVLSQQDRNNIVELAIVEILLGEY